MVPRVRISTESLRRIGVDAAENPTLEACGLLVGQCDEVTGIVATANVSPDPAIAFEIDPAALFATHRAARLRGLAVIGCYHSHPSGPAQPSPRDVAAAEPGALWLILGQGGLGAFRMRAGGYDAVELIAAPD